MSVELNQSWAYECRTWVYEFGISETHFQTLDFFRINLETFSNLGIAIINLESFAVALVVTCCAEGAFQRWLLQIAASKIRPNINIV